MMYNKVYYFTFKMSIFNILVVLLKLALTKNSNNFLNLIISIRLKYFFQK